MVRPRNGKWVADVKVGSLPRVRKSFVGKREAERFEAVTRAELQLEAMVIKGSSLSPTRSGDTVGKWIPIIARDIWGDNVNEVNMKNIIRTWIRFLGPDMLMQDIRTSHCERFVMERRAAGKANSTINQFTTRLNKMLKKAKRLDLIHTLPEIVSAGKVGHRQRYLTTDEADRLMDCFPPYYQCFVIFLLYTGARLSEAEGLRWRDVTEDTITFEETKNGKDRMIPLPRQVKQVLRTMRDGKSVSPSQLVFSCYNRSTFRRRWKAAKYEAGLSGDKEVVPHILRHTCASRLVRAGVNLATVQKYLGHSDVQTTMRYVHLDMSTLISAADALSGL